MCDCFIVLLFKIIFMKKLNSIKLNGLNKSNLESRDMANLYGGNYWSVIICRESKAFVFAVFSLERQ